MSPSPIQSTRPLQRTTWLLSSAAFGSALSQRVVDPLLPRLSSDFGQPLSIAAWTITSFTIGYALCQLFSGPLGDRYGKYTMVTLTTLASSVTALLCALAPSLSLLFAARVLAGATVAGIIPLSMAWLGDMVPYEQRQPVLARYLIGLLLGISVGQLLGGLSADHIGWRPPFLMIAIVFAASGYGLHTLRDELDFLASPTPVRDPRLQQSEFKYVLSQPWAQVVLLTVAVEGALVFGAFAFCATHIYSQLHTSLTLAGSIVMLFGVGGIIFAIASRRLVTSLGEPGLASIGGVIMALSLTTVAITASLLATSAACLALGVGFYMLHNTLQTNATQMAPEQRGTAVAAFAMSYFLGQSAGVAGAGWLVARTGTTNVMLIAAGGVCIVAWLFAWAKQRHAVQAQH